MATWLDNSSSSSGYNGCFLILNVGEDTVRGLSSEYIEMLKAKIADCHADGFLVLYVFDVETGPSKVPEDWDNIEGMDFIRMSFDMCGRRDFNFKFDPEDRNKEFVAMVTHLRTKFHFVGPVFICGRCQIDSTEVVMPPIEIKEK